MSMVTPILTGQDNSNSQDLYQSDKVMDKDDFLKLLIVQLQYQDPLSPMTNEDFIAQLAQFSSLEQLQNMNTNLVSSLEANSSLAETFNNAMAATFIGKDIRAFTNRVQLGESGSTDINFELSDGAANMAIEIFDSQGELVRTIERTSVPSGDGSVEWDGKDQQGSNVPAGEYTFSISATDSEGEPVDSSGIVIGPVVGVSYEDGGPFLLVGDNKVPLSQVIRIEDNQ